MYAVEWSEEARAELRELRSFVRPPVLAAVDELVHRAETETTNRKKLDASLGLPPGYPDPIWEIRVGEHRVLYTVAQETVTILGVRLKGRRTTDEIL
jgi:mRNA-degrading endonuclease RelE of RelBE toxin-antitoxin system